MKSELLDIRMLQSCFLRHFSPFTINLCSIKCLIINEKWRTLQINVIQQAKEE